MSFQAYINNIRAKTGMTPADFSKAAEEQGFLRNGKLVEGVKAGSIVKWLKGEFGLGHGHAMAVYAIFKGIKRPD